MQVIILHIGTKWRSFILLENSGFKVKMFNQLLLRDFGIIKQNTLS